MKKKNDLEILRAQTLATGCINEKTYEVDDSFRRGEISAKGVHTTAELVQLLESDPKIQFEGIFLAGGQDKGRFVRLKREQFLEHWKKNNSPKKNFKKALESFNGGFDYETGANLVGDDYVPIMGGPFNKQMYLHDSLRMYALGFHAYHHDPYARALVHITKDFTLGRGYRIDSKNEKALALWRAFEKVNGLQVKMEYIATELSAGGEIMLWWLPESQVYIQWQDAKSQESPKGLLPRVRMIDPSTVWEIITYPEDITRVLAYQQVFPTQYQIYTTKDKGSQVPSSKFVIQQIPADQVDHFKVNCYNNEKRGRSDLYPAFGFLKRLRDTIQYLVVQEQKNAAWAMDTTIEGSQTDLENYVNAQNQEKTLAPAGSEFVHTAKIKRTYLSNSTTNTGTGSPAVSACLDAVCAAVGIPVSYLGTAGGSHKTRASALVGTEPVTKKFESRQKVYERIVQRMWTRLMEWADDPAIKGAECEVTFPELISQDRSAKIKDLAAARDLKAVSHERMSNMIAQELQITTYDYDEEQEMIAKESLKAQQDSPNVNPLTSPPKNPAEDLKSTNGKPSAITSDEKAKIKKNDGA